MLSQQENTLELQLLILEQREELLKQNELKLQIFQTKAGQKLESIKTPKLKKLTWKILETLLPCCCQN